MHGREDARRANARVVDQSVNRAIDFRYVARDVRKRVQLGHVSLHISDLTGKLGFQRQECRTISTPQTNHTIALGKQRPRKRKPKPAGNPAGPASAGNNAQPAAGNRRRKRGGGGGAGGGNAQPLAAGEAGRDAGRDDDDGDNLGNA